MIALHVCSYLYLCLFFFFQAEDGIRDSSVTGVQTCALPIYPCRRHRRQELRFAHVFRDLRKNEKQESGGNSAQDHLLYATEAKEPHALRCGFQHHRGEQKRSDKQQWVFQASTRCPTTLSIYCVR